MAPISANGLGSICWGCAVRKGLSAMKTAPAATGATTVESPLPSLRQREEFATSPSTDQAAITKSARVPLSFESKASPTKAPATIGPSAAIGQL